MVSALLDSLAHCARSDGFCVTAFVHGSHVPRQRVDRSYRETRVFNHGHFVGSEFELRPVASDLDLVYVTSDTRSSVDRIRSAFEASESTVTLTANVVAFDEFREECFAQASTAMRRIIGDRPLTPLSGGRRLETLVRSVRTRITPLDRAFNAQFDARKQFLKHLMTSGVEEFCVTAEVYDCAWPLIAQGVRGVLPGFPPRREKLVLPVDPGLKRRLDLPAGELSTLR